MGIIDNLLAIRIYRRIAWLQLLVGLTFLIEPQFVFGGSLYDLDPFYVELYALWFIITGIYLLNAPKKPSARRLYLYLLPLYFHYSWNISRSIIQVVSTGDTQLFPILGVYGVPMTLLITLVEQGLKE